MPPAELATLLLRKADQDIYVLERLAADTHAPVEVFGFHAQQAAEKLIKAAIAQRSLPCERTHRLGELIDMAADHGLRFPAVVEALVDLTPFAVEYRYDAVPDEFTDDEMDKPAVLEQVRELREWLLRELAAS